MTHIAWTWEIRNAYKIMVGKPEGERPLRGTMRRLDDITAHLGEIGWTAFICFGTVVYAKPL